MILRPSLDKRVSFSLIFNEKFGFLLARYLC
jgi:hypothetical protein